MMNKYTGFISRFKHVPFNLTRPTNVSGQVWVTVSTHDPAQPKNWPKIENSKKHLNLTQPTSALGWAQA